MTLALDNRIVDRLNQFIHVLLFVNDRQQARTVVPDVHSATTQAGEKYFAVNQFLVELDFEQATEALHRHRSI